MKTVVRLGLGRNTASVYSPAAKVSGVQRDADEIGRDEAELGGAKADDADDGAIDGGNDPALPEFFAEQDRAQDSQDARDVIQANSVQRQKHGFPLSGGRGRMNVPDRRRARFRYFSVRSWLPGRFP